MFYKLLDVTESASTYLLSPLKPTFRMIGFNLGMLIRVHPTDIDLDKKIVEYLNDPNITPVRIREHLVRIGDLELWGTNVPYGSFGEYENSETMPRRTTVIRLLKALGEYPFDKPST